MSGIVGHDQRACQKCGALLARNASECGQCHTRFDAFGYPILVNPNAGRSTPAAEGEQLFRHGSLLIARDGAAFPDRCVKTNAPAGKRLRVQLYWHNPLLYLMIFFPGLLIYAIVAMIVRQKVTLEIPLSDERSAKRTRDISISWGLCVLGIFSLVVAGGSNVSDLILPGVLMILAAPIYWIAVGNVVSPRKIENGYVHLAGVCPEFLNELPPWPGR